MHESKGVHETKNHGSWKKKTANCQKKRMCRIFYICITCRFLGIISCFLYHELSFFSKLQATLISLGTKIFPGIWSSSLVCLSWLSASAADKDTGFFMVSFSHRRNKVRYVMFCSYWMRYQGWVRGILNVWHISLWFLRRVDKLRVVVWVVYIIVIAT